MEYADILYTERHSWLRGWGIYMSIRGLPSWRQASGSENTHGTCTEAQGCPAGRPEGKGKGGCAPRGWLGACTYAQFGRGQQHSIEPQYRDI